MEIASGVDVDADVKPQAGIDLRNYSSNSFVCRLASALNAAASSVSCRALTGSRAFNKHGSGFPIIQMRDLRADLIVHVGCQVATGNHIDPSGELEPQR